MQDNAVVRSLFPTANPAKKVCFYPENFVIESVEQLLFAEEILDAMDADLVDKVHYAALHSKAENYVKAHAELLHTPWQRAAGAVHDILESHRQQLGLAPLAAVPAHCH